MITKAIGVLLAFHFVLFLGAWLHESDMAKNCAANGNANAWFNEIECGVKK